MIKKYTILLLWVLVVLTTQAQSITGQYEWTTFFAGYDESFYPSQKILCTEVDDSGYVYYYGCFGSETTQGLYGLEGRFDSTQLDSVYNSAKYNTFIAKYDTLGHRIWMRTVRSNGQTSPGWMELHGDTIHLVGMCYMNEDNDYLSFFDTVIQYNEVIALPANEWRPPYATMFNYYTKMDLNGNVLNTIFMQCQDRAELYYHNHQRVYHRKNLTTLFGNGPVPMHVDKSGNLYLITNCSWHGIGDSVYTVITYNGDSTYRNEFLLPYNLEADTLNNVATCVRPMIYKFNSEGQLLWHKFLAFESEGLPADSLWYRLAFGRELPSGVFAHWIMEFHGMDVDEEDNLYLTGSVDMEAPSKWSDEYDELSYDYPCRIYFDSTHYIQMNNYAELQSPTFAIKLDTSGAVQWLNQPHSLYNEREHYQIWNEVIYGSITVSNGKAYLDGFAYSLFDEDTIFLGNGHWFDRNGASSHHTTFPLFQYLDLATGQCLDYGTHYHTGWFDDDGVTPAVGMSGYSTFKRHCVYNKRLYAHVEYQINPTQRVSMMATWEPGRREADTMRIRCLNLWDYHFYPQPGGAVLFDYTARHDDITLDSFYFTDARLCCSAVAFGLFRPSSDTTGGGTGGGEPIGIATEEDVLFSVFPNPFSKLVTIRYGGGEIVAAYLTDMVGRREEVRLVAQGGGQYVLNLANRNKGLYLLTMINTKGEKHTVRLVKTGDKTSSLSR